jgi:hypothetical protein
VSEADAPRAGAGAHPPPPPEPHFGGDPGDHGDHEDPRDLGGCLLFLARFTGCTTLLWVIMGFAIFAVALASLLFWR